MAKADKQSTSLAKVASGTLADLIGNAVSIKLEDGSTVIIPANRDGNRVANMIVAAEVRHLIQKSIKTYREKEMIATPKDLKDLAEAAKSLAQFSGEVYKESDGAGLDEKPKVVEKTAPPIKADEADFDAALEVHEDKK